jgi:hypothetical protein
MVPSTQHIIDTIRNEESFLKDRYFIKHITYMAAMQKSNRKPEVILIFYTQQFLMVT